LYHYGRSIGARTDNGMVLYQRVLGQVYIVTDDTPDVDDAVWAYLDLVADFCELRNRTVVANSCATPHHDAVAGQAISGPAVTYHDVVADCGRSANSCAAPNQRVIAYRDAFFQVDVAKEYRVVADCDAVFDHDPVVYGDIIANRDVVPDLAAWPDRDVISDNGACRHVDDTAVAVGVLLGFNHGSHVEFLPVVDCVVQDIRPTYILE